MNELQQHLSVENALKVQKLFPHPFGNLKRILYRYLRIFVDIRADKLEIDSKKVYAFANDDLVREIDIVLLNELAIQTYKEQLKNILETDKTLAKYVHIEHETEDTLVCIITYD